MDSAGPNRIERMKKEEIADWISQAASIPGISRVVLTGGEPFIVPDLARIALKVARDNAFQTTVITNCSWALSIDKAMQELRNLGQITTLGISLDRFHQKYVPLSQVENAVKAAKKLGIETEGRVAYCTEEDIITYRKLLKKVLKPNEISSQPILRFGRGKNLGKGEYVELDPQNIVCNSLERPAIGPGGLVYACCGPSVGFCTEGHPLILGNLNHDPLSSIVKRAQINLLLHFLRLHGPSTLYHIGVGEDLEKKAFENHCEVCLKVLSDQNILKKIWKHLNQPSIRREIALNRFFRFGEPELFLALDDRDEIINESFAY